MHVIDTSPLSQLPVKKLCHWPMRELTSLRLGGEADVILFPQNMDDLREVVATASAEGVPLYPLVGGTNLLVRDGGIRGALVSFLRGLNHITLEEDPGSEGTVLRAGAGVSRGRVCLFALKHCLEGLEGLIGIPGSLGGCLTMNAGVNSTCIGDRVKRVRVLTENGETVIETR